MKEALYYTALSEQKTECTLCPHSCIIKSGKAGICKVRVNREGKLYAESWGKPVALHTDPIEKKPLYHFFPGHQVLSIGTLGCNMQCRFCQNCEISQQAYERHGYEMHKSIDDIVFLAQHKQKNIGLAFTYNEPVVYYEYMMELSDAIHKAGLKNIMVSNGFINPEPLVALVKNIDAFNIDLKSCSQDFYKKYTSSELLPVLESIKYIHNSGKHLELTFLVIEGLNDDRANFIEMIDWICENTGKRTVLHISRYFPHYQMDIPPTTLKTMDALYLLAKQKLDFVYLGNIQGSNTQDTQCPVCQTILLKRTGYYTINEGLDRAGNCKKCGEKIIEQMEN
ncbi:MAG: AmmeMemoRadiSam system radical SAM enzyme [Bacteroidales bacterium]|nr:AmmeMemoRadiSam system radical SAM enzyme [Bacteroidales bacterium]